MQRNKSITRYKQKLLIFLSALFIALILQPKQTVYADDTDYSGWASSIVNGTGSSNTGGNSVIQNGVSYTRTGYLCYLLTKDGADTGLPAVAFKSPGFSALPGTEMRITSRRGHTVSSFEGGIAPWNCTPWAEGGSPTNAPQIKAWFESTELSASGTPNGYNFVSTYWGEEAAVYFGNDEYVLVIETLMHFQFSKPSDGLSNGELWVLAEELVDTIYGGDGGTKRLLEAAIDWGYENILDRWDSYKDVQQLSVITSIKQLLTSALVDELEATVGAGARTFVGPPLIGTVPNLIDFKNSTDPSMTVFDSYLNKVAPLAERIEYDEAGFITYTGRTSSNLPDSAILGNNGVAMLIIHANTTAQTTCDEPLIPSPHDPPKESDGKITIVKSYREKINGEEKHVATTSRSNLGTQIIIENEQTYQVVGWKITNQTNPSIISTPWNPPGSQQAEGTTPTSVTIEPTYTCLYVLLEKVEEEPPEEEDYNYLLSESSITRTVWFSNPDHNKLGNMNNPEWIYDHKFNWASPATPYCEGHPYKGACLGNHEGEHTSSCPKGCPSTCNLPSPHIHEEACDSHHYWNCGSNDCDLNNQTAKCSGTPEWVDQALTLTITNTKQNSYPDILATKEGWNAEVLKGGVEKRFYDNGQIERKQFSLEPHDKESEITNWDYVCVLLRGKDKLTVAKWENEGKGNGNPNNANTDLFEVSPPPSRFTIANTDSGTRKTVDYYETFDTFFNRDEEEGDVCTTGKFTIPPKDMPENEDITEPCQPEVKSFVNTLSINGVKVKVDVYSGTAEEHKNDTSIVDGHSDYDLSGFNRSSGRMVKSSNANGTIVFTPYIEMKYDTLDTYNKQAFVLSEFTKMSTTQKQNNM